MRTDSEPDPKEDHDRNGDTPSDVNPAARRDRPGEPHDDEVPREPTARREPPKGYQDSRLDPKDHGGIAE